MQTLESEVTDQAIRLELAASEKLQLTSKVVELKEKSVRAEERIMELQATNVDLNTARDEAIATHLSVQDELKYYKSETFKKHIIDYFKSSSDYHEEISREAVSFFIRVVFTSSVSYILISKIILYS